ncbi:hypothetical protein LTR05_004327 [Lithohypha guttulata]|uniref:Uncharacterized protein n=1 Tax=Lithohypha guttulata TaxID=1690604 RepID=A0AAN7T1K0_9EURO|nr:hypothetical protein LTR05_004327 [Lithohypha guttulata]
MENGDDLGCSREFILSELLRVLCQFVNSPTSSSSGPLPDQPGRLDLALLQETPQNSRQDKSLHSEAEFLSGGLKDMLSENASRARSTSRQPRSYVKASQAISRILSEIVLDSREQRRLLYEWTYPPGHLAYMSGDDDAAFELWQNPYNEARTDVLKRDLVHLAVYTSDAQMLQRMFRYDDKAAAKVTSDLFGLTPLRIAACRNDILCFSLVWQYDGDSALRDEIGQSVLRLAAKNGSCQVAALILGYSPRRPALLPALRAAINAGNEEISSIIVSHFNDKTCLDITQLRLTLREAQKAGFVEIASKLELIKQRSPATAIAQTVVDPAVFGGWNSTYTQI